MSAADLSDVVGYFFLAWAIGYCAGFLFKVVRNLFEAAVGGGG